MKYFTPELLKRYGSEDEDIAEPAAQEWERACKAYRKHLHALEPQLPKTVQDFLRNYNLHDARLMAVGIRKNPETLAPETQPFQHEAS